jgi:hypothetical protein
MGVDQPGDDSRLAELLHRDVRGTCNDRVMSYVRDPTTGVDQERGVLDRRSFDWKQPSGGQPARPHFNAESWAVGQFLP